MVNRWAVILRWIHELHVQQNDGSWDNVGVQIGDNVGVQVGPQQNGGAGMFTLPISGSVA